MAFDVFISYSSRDDHGAIGGWPCRPISELKQALESHRHPDTDEPLRVCTDREDFNLGGGVDDAIRAALRASHALLVVCSAAAVESPWPAKELTWFDQDRAGAPRIAVVLDKLPHVAFPAWFAPGELGADLGVRDGDDLAAWRARMYAESHKLAAAAWGLPVARVYDRWEAQTRARLSAELAARARALTGSALDAAAAMALAADAAGSTAEAAAALLDVGTRCQRLLRVEASRRFEIRSFRAAGEEIRRTCRAVVARSGRAMLLRAPDGELIIRRVDGRGQRSVGTVERASAALALSDDLRFAAVESEGLRIFSIDDASDRAYQPAGTPARRLTLASFAFTPTSETLVVGDGGGNITALALPDCTERWAVRRHKGPVDQLAFSSDGALLATLDGGIERWLRITRTADGSEVRGEPIDRPFRVAFSADGAHCLVTTQDKWLHVIPVATDAPRRRLFAGSRPTSQPEVCVGSNGAVAAAIGDQIAIWTSLDAGDFELIASPLSEEIVHLAFCPNPAHLVLADRRGSFAVIDVGRQTTVLGPIRIHEGLAGPPVVSAREHELVAVHPDAVVSVWDVSPRPVARSLRVARDGRALTSIADGNVLAWDAGTQQARGLPVPWLDAPPLDVALSPDARVLAIARRQGIAFWDRETGARRPASLPLPAEPMPPPVRGEWQLYFCEVEYSPSGAHLAGLLSFSAAFELRARAVVWDLARSVAKLVDDGVQGARWLADDRLLIAKEDSLAVWNAQGTERTWHASYEEFEAVEHIAVAVSGDRWLSAHRDGYLRLWEGNPHPGIRETIARPRTGTRAVLSADGGRLAWRDGDSIAIWDLGLRRVIGTVAAAGSSPRAFSALDGALVCVDDAGAFERLPAAPDELRRLARLLVSRPATQAEQSLFGGLDLRLQLPDERRAPPAAPWVAPDGYWSRDPRDSKDELDRMRADLDAHRYADALGIATKLLTANPTSWRARLGVAAATWGSGHPAQAVGLIDELIAIAPDHPTARVVRAFALLDLGRPLEALAEVDRAVELAPMDGHVHYSRAVVLGDLGCAGAALHACARALALDPGLDDAGAYLAKLLALHGRYDEAFAACDVLLKRRRDPDRLSVLGEDDDVARVIAAYLLARAGQPDQALARLSGVAPDRLANAGKARDLFIAANKGLEHEVARLLTPPLASAEGRTS